MRPNLPRPVPTRRQTLLWLAPILFVLLILASLFWLPSRVMQMEASDRQQQLIADTLWVEQTIRFQLGRNEDDLRQMAREIVAGNLFGEPLRARIDMLGRNHPELRRIAWIDANGGVLAAGAQNGRGLATVSSLPGLERARESRTPQYGQPVPHSESEQPILMDYYVPLYRGDHYQGSLVATYSVAGILNEMVPWWFARDNEILIVDRHDNVLGTRAAGGPGRGVYTHARDLHLPYADIMLQTDSVKSTPLLLPNLLVGSVIALSLGLVWSLVTLWRDNNRRMAVENALREQAAFWAAMEDALVTGLRARDLEGRVLYVNPEFCRMVGLAEHDLVGREPPMPYWAPEAMSEYEQRLAERKAGVGNLQGFETVFQRSDGERIPVLVYESPLLDESGRQTGWMGSILDISDRRRFEDLNRRQQEKLQASARLATMGEIASTLAHELNQPLAAISSYTTGALNLLGGNARLADGLEIGPIMTALEKANAQVQRAGQVIRSVHTFVRRREPKKEKVDLAALIANVVRLAELQGNQYFVAIHTEIEQGLPPVLGDPVMLEQVLLNLTRNGIEAMRNVTSARRLLRIHASTGPQTSSVTISVIDQGCGIAREIQERLFSPFFSTKADGMGMGLKICRSTIEFHGGTLGYRGNPDGGTIFHFSLPTQKPVTSTRSLGYQVPLVDEGCSGGEVKKNPSSPL